MLRIRSTGVYQCLSQIRPFLKGVLRSHTRERVQKVACHENMATQLDVASLHIVYHFGFTSHSIMRIVVLGYPCSRQKDKKKTSTFQYKFENAVKTKTRLGECYTCFGYETKTGVVRILVIFQDRPMFSLIIQKVSARAFH